MKKIPVSSLSRRPAPSHPLAVALEAARVSVTDAAVALGCSRTHLSALLHDKARPGRRMALKMAALTAELEAEQAQAEVRRA